MSISKVILNGTTLIDVTQKTVEANNLLSPNTALNAAGSDIVGAIASKSAADLSASGSVVTVPSGFYGAQVTKSIGAGAVAVPAKTISVTPTIGVSGAGVVSVSVAESSSVSPTVTAGYVSSGTAGTISVSGSSSLQLSTQTATTITPTESVQTAVTSGKYTTGEIKVGAISSTYIGSAIVQRSSTDLSASGSVVSVPSGYYAVEASKPVAAGSATTPAKTITANPTVSFNSSTGQFTATVAGSSSITPTVNAGYVTIGTAGTISVSGSSNYSLTTKSATSYTPSASTQTIPSGVYLTGVQTIDPIPISVDEHRLILPEGLISV